MFPWIMYSRMNGHRYKSAVITQIYPLIFIIYNTLILKPYINKTYHLIRKST